MIYTTQYVGDTCRVKEKGQGHVRPKIFGRTVFTVSINTPLPFLTSFTPLDLSLPLELLKPWRHRYSIVAGEEELRCLDLVAIVLVPTAEIFTPPPP